MSKELNQREFLLLNMIDGKKYGEILKEFPKVKAQQLTKWYDDGGKLQQNIRHSNELFNSKKVLDTFDKFKKLGRRDFFEWYENELKKGCGYCGIEQFKLQALFNFNNKEGEGLSSKRGRGRFLELERKDAKNNEYSKDNCILACYLCNNHKSDVISEADHRKYFAEQIKKYLDDKYEELNK